MELLDSWVRHLRARRRSPRTVDSYRADVRRLFESLGDAPVEDVTERDIEAFLVSEFHRGMSPATVVRRRRALHQFFRWLVDRGVLEKNPVTAAVWSPVSDAPSDLLTDGEMAALLGACSETRTGGRAGDFESRRDTAIVLMLITTGIRASELIALSVDDVDLDAETVRVVGRQGRERSIAMLRLPVAGLEAYLLARVNHRFAEISSSLWLGEKGPLTSSGLRQMLGRRSELADIRHVTPHLFRRTYAHEALRRGMSPEALMAAGGWSTDQMVTRYAPVGR